MTDELEALQDRTFEHANAATRGSYPLENRLTDGRLAAYLDERAFAVISSARPDGRPHAALTSYWRRGTTFWLPTVADSVRGRNVRHQAHVALTVTEGDHGEHIAVMIEGPAAVVTPSEVPPDVVADIDGDWAAEWIRIDAERILSYAADETIED